MSRKNRSAGARKVRSGTERALAGLTEIARRSPAHRRVLRNALARLLSLGDRITASLRGNASRRLHQVASLAVIGTLVLFTAACDGVPEGDDTIPEDEIALVQSESLSAEVAQGLPTARGQTFAVRGDSLSRDDRGVYYFDWQQAGGSTFTSAQVSNLRLKVSESATTTLEMPATGDPILHLAADTPIALVWPSDGISTEAGATVTVTPTPSGYVSGYHSHVGSYYPGYYHGGYHSSSWLPFAAGVAVGRGTVDPSASVASYRNPAVGQSIVPNQPLTGNVASQTPPPFVDRAISRTAVSGMSKGTGGGYAVTGKTASTVKTSSFSSGKSGASVTTGRVGAATGKSGSGVSSPKSSGFSAGKGSSSGGAAS